MSNREFDAGYQAGFDAGRREGFVEGHRTGFFEGHRAGWEQGVRDARPMAPPGSAAPSRPAPAPPRPPLLVPPRPAPPAQAPNAAGPPVLRPAAEFADEAKAARRRERRGLQNANIALYAASLLIVSAGALFLASGADDGVRVAALIFVTALFYAAGLGVHARFPRLRPAAVAFTGTGLALLPVSGLAVDVILVHRPALTWLLTSVIGLAAFGAAAVRLESRILVYLSLTFAFSAAWSGASALGGALAVDLAALLCLSAALGALAVLRPQWVPPIILRSVIRLHPFVGPAIFAAATVACSQLDRWQYPALVAALCLYFAIASALRGPSALRRLSWWSARTTAIVAAGAGLGQAADAGLMGSGTGALDAGAVAAGIMLAGQAIAVALFERRLLAGLAMSRRMVLREQILGVIVLLVILSAALAMRVLGIGGSQTALFALSALCVVAQFVGWWHGRATEALPVVVFAVIALVHGPLGREAFAALSLIGVLYWLARAVWPAHPAGDAGGWNRSQYAVAARIASLITIPAVVDAILPNSMAPGTRVAAVATAMVLTGVLHLTGTAVYAGLGRGEFARGPVAGLMAASAVCGSIVAAVAEPRPHAVLHVLAAVGCCVAALAVSATLFDGAVVRGRRTQLGEWLPGVMLSVVAVAEFAANRWGAGNAALASLCVVSGAAALRAASSRRRWIHGWITRAAATALVLAVFQSLAREGWVLSVLGQTVTLWHVLGVMALVQLSVPLAFGVGSVRRNRRPFLWALEDATVVLALAAAACAALAPTGGFSVQGSPAPGPLTASLVIGFAVGGALVGVLLRFRPAALAVPPAVFVLSWVLAHADLRVLEILTVIFSAYSAIMVLVVRERRTRGAHLVAARALPLLLVALVAQDTTASPTVLSVALAVGLVAQHIVRRLLQHTASDLPFQNAAYWSGLVGQLAMPVVYAATSRGESIGGRWVVLVESLLVVGSVLLTLRDQPKAGYVGIAGLVFALAFSGPAVSFTARQLFAQPLLTGTGLALTACLLTAAHVVGMAWWDGAKHVPGSRASLWPWTAGASGFAVVAATAGVPEAAWVLGLGLGACAAVLFAVSSVWRHVPGAVQASFPLGALIALAAGIAIGHSVFEREATPWGDVLAVLVGGVVPAGVGVAVRWAVVWAAHEERLADLARLGADPVKRWSLVGAAALAILIAARVSWAPPAAPVLPFLALALVGLAVSEVRGQWRRLTAELGLVLVVAAVQRAVFAGTSGESPFWLAQWYVVLAALVALARYIARDHRVGEIWLASSAGLATLTGLFVAFSADGPQQVWLLVAFAGLVGAGVTVGDRRFTVWGALGVLACVLWAVRAYPYLLLGALGLALIGFAVWWLVRAPRGTLLP